MSLAIHLTNQESKSQGDQLRKTETKRIQDAFGFTIGMLKNPNNTQFLYELLWNSGADPCEDILIYCQLKEEEKDCKELFHIMPTSIGPCCVFNMDSDIFRNSPFSEVRTLYQSLMPYKVENI